MGERPIILVAGAAGDLGNRIAKALIARGAAVRTTIRREDPQDKKAKLSALGLTRLRPTLRASARCRAHALTPSV